MNEPTTRAVMRVPGMDTDLAASRVKQAISDVPGVHSVAAADGERVLVEYDPSEVTVMEFIRAVRRIGFLAGIE